MSKFYDYQGLLVEVIKHTAVITFDNPPAHTWTSQSLTSLRDLVLELNNDDDIYALFKLSNKEINYIENYVK